ncbi:hypothetical protein [Clostridium cavendishii]|nr:hypothetical protein [Clostridium cavendishii]
MERVYKPLDILTDDEIKKILENGIVEELLTLSLSVGQYNKKWKYAQDVCVKLAEHEDSAVRANAVLGLAYIARTKGKLEKHIVKPIILRELSENVEFRWRIIDAIEDINVFMKWNLGKNALKHLE